MDFSINCMLIASDMEYLNKYLKYSFKVDDYCEDNNHELEVSTVIEVSKVQEKKKKKSTKNPKPLKKSTKNQKKRRKSTKNQKKKKRMKNQKMN